MSAPRNQISLRISGHDDADPSELAREVLNLRSELLALDIDSVDAPAAGPAPPGSKGSVAEVAGTLLLTMQQSVPLISALVGALHDWISRDAARSVKIELDGQSIDVAGITADQQERLIQAFLDHPAT